MLSFYSWKYSRKNASFALFGMHVEPQSIRFSFTAWCEFKPKNRTTISTLMIPKPEPHCILYSFPRWKIFFRVFKRDSITRKLPYFFFCYSFNKDEVHRGNDLHPLVAVMLRAAVDSIVRWKFHLNCFTLSMLFIILLNCEKPLPKRNKNSINLAHSSENAISVRDKAESVRANINVLFFRVVVSVIGICDAIHTM